MFTSTCSYKNRENLNKTLLVKYPRHIIFSYKRGEQDKKGNLGKIDNRHRSKLSMVDGPNQKNWGLSGFNLTKR